MVHALVEPLLPRKNGAVVDQVKLRWYQAWDDEDARNYWEVDWGFGPIGQEGTVARFSWQLWWYVNQYRPTRDLAPRLTRVASIVEIKVPEKYT